MHSYFSNVSDFVGGFDPEIGLRAQDNLGVKKVLAPSKCLLKCPIDAAH